MEDNYAKQIIELTEKEKEAYKTYSERYIEDPLSSIEEGLVSSYYYAEDYKKFEKAVYEYAKRLLTEVAKKRNLTVDSEETFEINDMIENNRLEDFNLEYYEDYGLLKNYIENKTKDMNAVEVEEFYNKMGGRIGMQDDFREFMTRYVPKITSNVYELYAELNEKETVEKLDEEIIAPDDPDWGYQEGEEQENTDWADEEIEKQEATEQNNDFEWVSDDDDWLSELENQQEESVKEKVSDEELLEYIKFLNTYTKLNRYKSNGMKVVEKLGEIVRTKKLNEFYNNNEFFENFKNIMNHDKEKHNYLFHGTQDLTSAENIMNEGLGMMREDLPATTYSEFSMDDVILYSRGFAGEIGRDAIVIIDQPINDAGEKKDIVQKLDEDKEIHFAPSGLQGLDGKPQYIVDPKYIIGFVNKKDKEIVYNPKYYSYDKCKNKGQVKENSQVEDVITVISETDIGKSTINVETFKKDTAKQQMQSDLQQMQDIDKINNARGDTNDRR